MKTIVVATDYSRPAKAALEYAAQLASFTGARLVLYNAFHLAIPSSTPPATLPDVDELIANNNRKLEAMATEISRRFQINAQSFTTTLTFLDGLKKGVKQFEADLVVMGMKTNSLGRRLFGSSSTDVIEESDCPVLIVPEKAQFTGITNILFACDYNSIAADHTLELLVEISNTFRAHVQVLHVGREAKQASMADSPEALKNPLMEEILQQVPHAYHFIQESDVVEGLKKGIQAYEANLMVMVPHTASHWDKLLHRSKTREMALETPVPLLVLPNPRRKAFKKENIKPLKVS